MHTFRRFFLPGGSAATRHKVGLAVFAALTLVVAACSNDDDRIAGPSSLAAQSPDSGRKPGRDTTKNPRDTARVDTTPPVYTGKVAVSGRILGINVIAPTAGSRDTIQFVPVALAKIRVMRNVLVNGAASQVLAAELTSDAAGQFSIKDLAGGYYIVYADPPEGSGYEKNWSYLAALKPEVTVDVYLWKKQ